jgi:quercetin dioxygenase-like cupin family protein
VHRHSNPHGQGITDASLATTSRTRKKHGVTRAEIAAVITHATMYCGWPKGWAVFNLIKEVWGEDEEGAVPLLGLSEDFPMGEPNDAYAQYFIGQQLAGRSATRSWVPANVTFEPGCRNNWHVHHKGGQVLICIAGAAGTRSGASRRRSCTPGDVVSIAPEVKHWHGAAKDSWFQHIALTVPAEGASAEWLEPVTDEEYAQLA